MTLNFEVTIAKRLCANEARLSLVCLNVRFANSLFIGDFFRIQCIIDKHKISILTYMAASMLTSPGTVARSSYVPAGYRTMPDASNKISNWHSHALVIDAHFFSN